MDLQKDGPLWRFKWHIVIICVALALVFLLALLTDIFEKADVRELRYLVWLLGALVFLSALLAMLSRVFKMLDALRDNSAKLEQVAGALEKIRDGLMQINHSTRVSETAKAIAFRDADKRSLREAVFEKLQQQDFTAAYQLIDEIAERDEYEELAEQLRSEADRYQHASDRERLNQSIAYVGMLLENYQWATASTRIEELIKTQPDCQEAKALRQELLDKKQHRKKALLAEWDEAVKRQETDRSLELLKELDLYLSPNEALALQEAASDVFRTKLHNLGIEFSTAVSEKRWDQALQIGQQIVNDFPNSKMAEEIRDKLDVLRQNVQMQNS